MDRRTLTTWIERYEAAWRTAGTAVLDHLFADDATYSPAPFDEVMTGRAAIADFWEAEATGPTRCSRCRRRLSPSKATPASLGSR